MRARVHLPSSQVTRIIFVSQPRSQRCAHSSRLTSSQSMSFFHRMSWSSSGVCMAVDFFAVSQQDRRFGSGRFNGIAGAVYALTSGLL